MLRLCDFCLDAWGTQLIERVQLDTLPWRDDPEYFSRLVAIRGVIDVSEYTPKYIEDWLVQCSYQREWTRRRAIAERC